MRFSTPTCEITRIKHETPIPSIKADPNEEVLNLTLSVAVKTRSLLKNDVEVLEILSSDDEVMLGDQDLDGDESDMSQWPGLDQSDYESEGIDSMDEEEEEDSLLQLPTDWNDPKIDSQILKTGEKISVTRQVKVQRVELLEDLPSIWLVPQVPTAYIVNLHQPKFVVIENGKALTPDMLIKNKVCPQFSSIL